MENRIQYIFLTLLMGVIALPAAAQEALDDIEEFQSIIEPEVQRRVIERDEIDTENFELGVHLGVLSIEDFGVNTVYSVRLSYHINEDIFVEGSFGTSDADETSFESLSGDVRLLTNDDRTLNYYNASFGYNVLPGESFVGENYAFSSALYLIGGIGKVDFGGDDNFAINFGFGYRLVLTDWLTVHLDVRDYLFDSEILGDEKTTQNLEFTTGISIFF